MNYKNKKVKSEYQTVKTMHSKPLLFAEYMIPKSKCDCESCKVNGKCTCDGCNCGK